MAEQMTFSGDVDGAVAHRHLAAPTPAAAFTVDDGDGARFRALRESPLAATLLGRDRFAKFWFYDLRRLALFLAIMGETSWLRGGQLGCFSLGLLAQRSQMSVARVSQLIDAAITTGDFLRERDARDARLLTLEPSAAARAALDGLMARFCESSSAYLDRSDPVPGMLPEERRLACTLFARAVLDLLEGAAMDNRATGSTVFFLGLLDLKLHSPVAAADFVRREASRLRVTKMTIRNLLRRAEASGFVRRRGRLLQLTGAAEASIEGRMRDVGLRIADLHAGIERVAARRPAAGVESGACHGCAAA